MKRQLKPLRQRKPAKTTTVVSMAKHISKETGFREEDILMVIKSLISYTKSCILKGMGVSLPKLGIFYPLIKPARTVMSMNGGVGTPTKMKMSDRWQMKFKASESIDKALLGKIPTQKEVDNLYES